MVDAGITPPAHSFRPDIEGLRAVAILLVVAFHAAVPGFGGGFIGVDVFFVLSGYLITKLLVDELARNGQIDFKRFYARRARRLLPGAALMLFATIVASRIVYAPLEQQAIVGAALTTAVYASNIWFARNATDYLGEREDLNPLLHTWSLAVEEQFYLVWPALVGLSGRGRRDNRIRITVAIVSVTIGSLVLSIWLTHRLQPWAFFGSPARAWEFGVGALGSRFTPRLKRLSPGLVQAFGMSGLLLILVSSFVISRTTPFPGIAAIWPALGTVAVLVSGEYAPDQPMLAVLRSRPFQALGRLSYSWYLWHWPVLVVAVAYFGRLGLAGRVAASICALAIAAIAHALVENRVRYSSYLVPRSAASLGVAAAITLAGLGLGATWQILARRSASEPAQRRFADARDDLPRIYGDGCHLRILERTGGPCVFGNTTSAATVVLFGDSHAANWFPPLERIATAHHWRLISLTKSACPSVDVDIYYDPLSRSYTECTEWRAWALDRISTLRPALVIVSNAHTNVRHDLTAATHRVTDKQWTEGLRKVVAAIRSSGSRVTLLVDAPTPGIDVPTCLSRAAWTGRSGAITCAASREQALDPHTADDEARATAGMTGIHILDLSSLICGPRTCIPEMGGTIVYRDRQHLTARFSRSLAPAMAESLLADLPPATPRP